MVVCHGKKFRTSVMMILIRVEIGQPPRANPKITAGGDRKSPSSPISCWKSPTKTKKAFQLIWSFILVTDSIIKALKTGEFLDLEFPTTQLIMPPYLKNLGESKLSHLKITVDWEDDMRRYRNDDNLTGFYCRIRNNLKWSIPGVVYHLLWDPPCAKISN